MVGTVDYKTLCITNRQRKTRMTLQSHNIYIFMGRKVNIWVSSVNLGASWWLISLTQLLKPFRRATQAGDCETAEESAFVSRRTGGRCRQEMVLLSLCEKAPLNISTSWEWGCAAWCWKKYFCDRYNKSVELLHGGVRNYQYQIELQSISPNKKNKVICLQC